MNNKIIILIITVFITLTICGVMFVSFNYFLKKEKDFIVREEAIHYKAIFNLNGASSVNQRIVKCTKEEKGCFITFPKAMRENGVVLGYSDQREDIKPKYFEGDIISIDSDTTYYVISYKILKLHIDNSDIDFLASNDLECKSYNKIDACKVKLPFFNKKGYENRGYSSSSSSTTGFVFPNEEYEISKDSTLYPIYGTVSRSRSLQIDRVNVLPYGIIEKEDMCSEENYQTLLGYVNEISMKAPYLVNGGKISFVGDKTFDEVWGNKFVGMNFGPRRFRALDVRCSNYLFNNNYATMVHELGHSWDFYYETKIGKNISSESDVINLYNKYLKDNNRPFRDYSYSSLYEFFADMVRYYYFKYIVPSGGFNRLDYPSDIKKTMEKYICIANNDYDTTKCK